MPVFRAGSAESAAPSSGWRKKHSANRLLGTDEAQRTHPRAKNRQLSCKGAGIQAHGRTTSLKINYRSMRQML